MAVPSNFMTDINQNGHLEGKLKDNFDIFTPTVDQKYPIGFRMQLHGREWAYCRAYEAITITHRGNPCMVDYPWIATSVYSAKGTTTNDRAVGVAGRKSIVCEFDDVCVTYSQKKNFFAGGFATIFFDSNLIATMRITGSDVSTADPDTAADEIMTIYFDEPLPTAIISGVQVDLYASPYMCVGASGSGTAYTSFVCVAPCAVTADYFFWGQVKGPCWVTPNAGITTANIRDVGFHTNGTIKTYTAGLQRAGYIIYKGDGSQDDAIIMLDI